jgi:hypothetical protein
MFVKLHHDMSVKIYAPQTKILEGGTKDEMRIFDGAFNDS